LVRTLKRKIKEEEAVEEKRKMEEEEMEKNKLEAEPWLRHLLACLSLRRFKFKLGQFIQNYWVFELFPSSGF
jgi:hypothetical protein